MNGLIQAVQGLRSSNHQARQQAVKQLLAEAGESGHAIPLLHYRDGQFTPAVAAVYKSDVPHAAPYLASWMGVLSQQPGTAAFIPGQGEDTLHTMNVAAGVDKVAQAMVNAGHQTFSIQPQTTQSCRVFLLDPGSQFDLSPVGAQFNASPNRTTGRSTSHGISEGATPYRDTIRSFESSTGTTPTEPGSSNSPAPVKLARPLKYGETVAELRKAKPKPTRNSDDDEILGHLDQNLRKLAPAPQGEYGLKSAHDRIDHIPHLMAADRLEELGHFWPAQAIRDALSHGHVARSPGITLTDPGSWTYLHVAHHARDPRALELLNEPESGKSFRALQFGGHIYAAPHTEDLARQAIADRLPVINNHDDSYYEHAKYLVNEVLRRPNGLWKGRS